MKCFRGMGAPLPCCTEGSQSVTALGLRIETRWKALIIEPADEQAELIVGEVFTQQVVLVLGSVPVGDLR